MTPDERRQIHLLRELGAGPGYISRTLRIKYSEAARAIGYRANKLASSGWVSNNAGNLLKEQ